MVVRAVKVMVVVVMGVNVLCQNRQLSCYRACTSLARLLCVTVREYLVEAPVSLWVAGPAL